MSKEILHVVPHNEGWAVKREGNERNSSTHGTQHDAIDSARELAHEGDDIVIHRHDGTIRDRTTYVGTNGATTEKGETITPSDVRSVGTRVSWAAVLAGAAVALTAYLTLTMLALAIGVTAGGALSPSTFALGTAIVMAVALLGALFLGGYVASQITAGETKKEAVIYGVLVWAAMFGLLFLGGNAMSIGFGSAVQALAQAREVPSLSEQELQQRTAEQRAEHEQSVEAARANATPLAWWAFGTLVLSLMAAIGGALVGAGPELTFWRPVVGPNTPAPSPARTA